MKIFRVQEETAEKAALRLAGDLGVEATAVEFHENSGPKQYAFKVLNVPTQVDVEISRDGMKAIWKTISFPIGKNVPAMTPDAVVQALARKGVKAGLKMDVLENTLKRILGTPHYKESTPINLVIAEGLAPVAGQAGVPKWTIDLKLFEKNIPLYIRKAEVIAKAPRAVPGVDGYKVSGEVLVAPVEEQFRLQTGNGIEVQKTKDETVYVAKTFGRLFFDQGIRMRIESKVFDEEGGMKAIVETLEKSFTGARITGKDLAAFAAEQNVRFGAFNEAQIEAQLKAVKKWPARIILAQGQPPQDGKPGEVVYLFKKPLSDRAIDLEKVKAGYVFPGEVVAKVAPAKPPTNGSTVFGEVLRGRPYQEVPVYPGKNINKEKDGDFLIFKAATYGRVKIEKDRIHVEGIVKVSTDKMTATIDLFPQQKLSILDALAILREADILYGFDKTRLEARLNEAFEKGERIPEFKIAEASRVGTGQDAKLIYYFDRDAFKKKGIFSSNTPPFILAAPQDLLMVKILPVDPSEGFNLYREKISAAQGTMPKDISVEAGDQVIEKLIGRDDDPKDPPRLEYRAKTLGEVTWNGRVIDLKPCVQFDGEKSLSVTFLPQSSFGTKITRDTLKTIAEHEGVKVDLKLNEVDRLLKEYRADTNPGPIKMILAEAQEAKHGENAKIEFHTEYNGKPIASFFKGKQIIQEAPLICDYVRPGDVLVTKQFAGKGEDGKTIFGKRIPADRGREEIIPVGEGIERSEDGAKGSVKPEQPGVVILDNGKLTVVNPVQISKDKMQATMTIYPSSSPRFAVKEDKILAMLMAKGVRFGVSKEAIREAIEEATETQRPVVDKVVASGRAPVPGNDASFFFSIDVGESVGEVRKDGSIDFKNRSIYQNIRSGQLLLVKKPAGPGIDGMDVKGDPVKAPYGNDIRMEPGSGVTVSEHGTEFRATRDGIVEIHPTSIRVIPGLLVQEDVSFKTGNIKAGSTPIIVKGAVLPDFEVSSEKDVVIEKVAEACRIFAGEDVKVRGGIIGRERGYVRAQQNIETFYISAGATVEAGGDILVGTEIMNSYVRTSGMLTCEAGAGTVYGGEIWVFKGMKARVIGNPGSQTPTVIRMGENYFEYAAAQQKIKEENIDGKIQEMTQALIDLTKELTFIYEQIPAAAKVDVNKSQKLQTEYRSLFEKRKELVAECEALKAYKENILNGISRNKDVFVAVSELIHPGVTFIYKDVVWTLKEPLRGAEIRWNELSKNLMSKRF